jgi:S1-C subfamily serine protease
MAANILGERKALGVEIFKVDTGIKVQRVHKGGPADLSGIKAEDILTEFYGEKLAAMDLVQFLDTLLETQFGLKAGRICVLDHP